MNKINHLFKPDLLYPFSFAIDFQLNFQKIGYMSDNQLKKTRESLLMSKAELARAARVSPITITRIENGMPCRMETKRKIILALGLELSEKAKIFKD
jgi:DNA-binding XRE family transcriptional regulator